MNNPAHKWDSDIHTAAFVPALFSEVVMIDNIEDLDSMSAIITDIIVSRLTSYPEESPNCSSNNLILYAGALFLHWFPSDLPKDNTKVKSIYAKLHQACIVLLRYKNALFDTSGPDALLEDRFNGWVDVEPAYSWPQRFTNEWWDMLGNSFLPSVIDLHLPSSANVKTENVVAKFDIGDDESSSGRESRVDGF